MEALLIIVGFALYIALIASILLLDDERATAVLLLLILAAFAVAAFAYAS